MTKPNYVCASLSEEDRNRIFKAIMQRSRDGLFVTDHTGKVVMINQATEEMCEIKSSQVIGRNVKDLVRMGMWNHAVALRVINEKKIISRVQTIHNKKKILTTGIPIFDSTGRLRFVLTNDRDVSTLSCLFETLELQEPLETPLRFELSEYSKAADEMEGIIVHSAVMANVLNKALRTARYDIPLVFTGESGVGKSMIARLVHRISSRRDQPFVDLNCGAIAENLLESELFGHEKGAFTGASLKGKKGIVECADNGTLFLDEIGEIPLNLQVKLLKFIESREIRRVGGTSSKKINVRIITATNRNLEEMVKMRSFRGDLFFRLNVVPIKIPALRERREEIKPLALMFLNRFNKEFNTRKTLSKTVLETLIHYDFPGNVRELENMVKRLIAISEGDLIRVKHLPQALRSDFADKQVFGEDAMTDYQQTVAAFEKQIILEAVRKHGSQRKAAQALGLNQSTLSRKINR
ncbi:sigma-54 interaction domain-containing protein [Desulfospira joergensenii]|uniref:sigma-54 interaction domain-containing protein n=1 Tax=Desulfospira joergensenii TaxID=53329 RepID=UPI0003B5DB22|nr:sigma-54-dependent Fis family transcriptional regulator [Desulfospira joergensenii]